MRRHFGPRHARHPHDDNKENKNRHLCIFACCPGLHDAPSERGLLEKARQGQKSVVRCPL